MAKYQTRTLGEYLNLLKRDVKAALHGKMILDDGSIDISKEEAEKEILKAFDEVAFHALRANASGRALERFMEENGLDIMKKPETWERYMAIELEEERKYNDYKYEEE